MTEQTLGDRIRAARIEKKLSLRDAAAKLHASASYLSDIENDRRVPAEALITKICNLFALNYDDIMAVAARLGEDAERQLRRKPALGSLLRTASRMSNDDIAKLVKQIESRQRSQRK